VSEGIPLMNCSLSANVTANRKGHAPGTTRLEKKEVNLWNGRYLFIA